MAAGVEECRPADLGQIMADDYVGLDQVEIYQRQAAAKPETFGISFGFRNVKGLSRSSHLQRGSFPPTQIVDASSSLSIRGAQAQQNS